MSPREKLLAPEEVADMLGVHVRTLSNWRASHRYALPWVKIGRSVKYRLSDVEAFIESRTERPVEMAGGAA